VFVGWFVFVAVSVLAANVLKRAHGAAFAFAGKTAPADAGRRFAVSGKRIA